MNSAAAALGRIFSRTESIPFSGCLLWMGPVKKRDGYGLMEHSGRTRLVHRVVWELLHGEIPPKIEVMHGCDVSCCINPNHLSLGTRLENERDKVAKGRQYRKLSDEQVLAIRADPRTTRKIASDYNISSMAVSQIKRRTRRANVKGDCCGEKNAPWS